MKISRVYCAVVKGVRNGRSLLWVMLVSIDFQTGPKRSDYVVVNDDLRKVC